MKKSFNPTAHQINAAENLFLAMALHQTVKAIFEKIETELLATEQYHYSEIYYTDKWKKRGFNYPEDRIIRDIKHTYQMEGLTALHTPEYEGTDNDKYYKALHFITKDKFVHAENANCVTDNNVTKMENALIEATESIHNLKLENIIMMDHRKELIDLLLKLFSSIVKPSESKKIEYHNKYILSPENSILC